MDQTTIAQKSHGGRTEFGPKCLLSNSELILGLNLPPDPRQAIPDDRFSENRVGLDHISFNVDNLEVIQNAEEWFEDKSIPHGEIKALTELGIYILPFRDPDNIQLELTAPIP